MGRFRWLRPLIVIVVVMLVIPMTSCITITPHDESPSSPAVPGESSAKPVINSFTASPNTISPGQSLTLSWNISGAKTVTISPAVGNVNLSGAEQLSPTTTTTYTLTAVNDEGSSTSSITVTVTKATIAVTAKPDLVITEVWLIAKIVYYKIKNQGDAKAGSSRAYLYANGVEQTNDHAAKLDIGEERIESFSSYEWKFSGPQGSFGTVQPDEDQTLIVKVCADAKNTIDESDEDNNCGNIIFGQMFSYDFIRKAHLATWKSSAGELRWPMIATSKKGAAVAGGFLLEDGESYSNSLGMYPEQVSNGWIQGRFGSYYVQYGETRSKEISIPEQAKFTAKVGFKKGATATDGVTVAFGYVNAAGSIEYFKKMDVYYDEVVDSYEVDLSSMAGEKAEFVLWVESKGSGEQDLLVWVEPQIIQEP